MKIALPRILLSVFLFLAVVSTAQTVTKPTVIDGPRFNLEGNLVTITFKVDAPSNSPLEISGLVLKDDNDPTYIVKPQTKFLVGDYGTISGAKSGTIYWSYMDDIGATPPPSDKYYFELNVTYDTQTENAAFNSAKTQNTVKAYDDFVANFKGGRRVFEALKLRQQLLNDVGSKDDNDAFTKAKQLNTPASYDTYINAYPNGKHLAEAKKGKLNCEKGGPLLDFFGIGPLMRMHDFTNFGNLSVGASFYINPLVFFEGRKKVEPVLDLEVSCGAGVSRITPKSTTYFKGQNVGVSGGYNSFGLSADPDSINGIYLGNQSGTFAFRDPNVTGKGFTVNGQTVGYQLVDSVNANNYKRPFFIDIGVMPGFCVRLANGVRLRVTGGIELGYSMLSVNENYLGYLQQVSGPTSTPQSVAFAGTFYTYFNNNITYNMLDLSFKGGLGLDFPASKRVGFYVKADFSYCPLMYTPAFLHAQYSNLDYNSNTHTDATGSTINPAVSHGQVLYRDGRGGYIAGSSSDTQSLRGYDKVYTNYLGTLKGQMYLGLTFGFYIAVKNN